MTVYSPYYLEANEFTLTGAPGRITPAYAQDLIDSAFGAYFTTVTGSYTAALTDAGTTLLMNSSSALNFTVPPNSSVNFLVGTKMRAIQLGTGALTVVAGSGVTFLTALALTSSAQYAGFWVEQTSTNNWLITGVS